MHSAHKDRLRLETELAGAAERGELVLHYQPVVCLNTGELRGLEALVRWKHPERGMVPPGDFIPIAEDCGAVVAIGNWVLAEACRQLGVWNREFPHRRDLVVSVNVSAKQLISPSIVERVSDAIRAGAVGRGQLAIEVTESAIIEDPAFASRILNQIKDLGVGIYMDDFGTGYTSLSHLHRLPLTCLKIDRSFMQAISERRDYAAVVQTIVTLAQNLGIAVVAEGVETPEQLAMLQAMDCDRAQGFLFGRAVDAAGVEQLLRPPVRAAA